jgi:hypothetical protein
VGGRASQAVDDERLACAAGRLEVEGEAERLGNPDGRAVLGLHPSDDTVSMLSKAAFGTEEVGATGFEPAILRLERPAS